MGREASKCWTDSFVSILPVPSIRMSGALLEKWSPFFKPQIQQFCKCRFVCNREGERQSAKLLGGIKFGSGSEISSGNGDLVKLAHLYGHIFENLHQPWSSVHNDGFNNPSCLFQCMSCPRVLFWCLWLNFMEVNVFLEPWTPNDEYPVTATEKCGVGNSNNGLGFFFWYVQGSRIQLSLYPSKTAAITACKVMERLTMPNIGFPEVFSELAFIATRYKFLSTILTLIGLFPTCKTTLYNLYRRTSRTLFLCSYQKSPD